MSTMERFHTGDSQSPAPDQGKTGKFVVLAWRMKSLRSSWTKWLKIFPLLLLIGGLALVSTRLTFGQEGEIEPNDTCAGAQALGVISLPFTIIGNLESVPYPAPGELSDVDFFRFSATSAEQVLVDLEGSATGKGTLGDPYLGFFDSSCNLIDFNDDSGSLNSRLIITVPDDGIFTLGATGCCDAEFIGNYGGGGTYQLTIGRTEFIGSIQGLVLDESTALPINGDELAYAFVDLHRWHSDFYFEYVATAVINSSGEFAFDESFGPIQAGEFQVTAYAAGYLPRASEIFAVSEGQHFDVGELALTSVPAIGSISGRVVDASNGAPLPGAEEPYAFVDLYQCDEWGCFLWMNSQSTDDRGGFYFDRDVTGNPLPPGSYVVTANAFEYQSAQTETFAVAEDEHYNTGDIALIPFPIRFSEIRPCEALPPEGGSCRYSAEIVNRSGNHLKGAAWSLVDSWGTGSSVGYTQFQTGGVKRFSLPADRSRVISFEFEVPGTVPDGSWICSQMFVGQDGKNPFFNTIGQRYLFCIEKGSAGFSLLSDQEARNLMREKHSQKPSANPQSKP